MSRKSPAVAENSSSAPAIPQNDVLHWLLSTPAFAILCLVSGCGFEFESETLSANMRGFHAAYSEHALDSNRFVVFAPHGDRSADCEPLPMLVFLNGGGENGENGLTQIHNNFGVEVDRLQEYHPFIAVCVQTSRERRCPAGGQQIKQVMKIVDDVIEEFNADPDRVILTGVSQGGFETWDNAADIPDRFAAAVPISGNGGPDADHVPKSIAEARLPLWAIYNAGDRMVAPTCRENVRQLLELGCSPMVTEYQHDSHDAWSRGYLSKAMYTWCLEQNRNRREPKFRWVNREDLLQESATPAIDDESTVEDVADCWEFDDSEYDGFVATSNTLGTVALPAAHKSKEVHFSMWPSAATASRIGFFPEGEKDVPEFTLTFRDLHSGWTDLTGPLGEWITKLDAVTQQQLTAGEWNDVRLSVVEDQLLVRINGWKAEPLLLPSASGELQIRLMPPQTGRTRFRYVRYRLDQNASVASHQAGAEK